MRGPDAREAPGLRLDHGAEIVSAHRALLLEIVSNGRQIVVGQCFAQELPVRFSARVGCCAQCHICRRSREKGMNPPAAMS